jgi:YggT family protein
MSAIRALLGLVVLLFFLMLIGRLVLDWIQVFARDWRPRGPSLVAAEAIYSVTEPPLRALRKILPPIRLGQVQIDLAFTVLFLLTVLVMQFVR